MIPIKELVQLYDELAEDLLQIVQTRETLSKVSVIYKDGSAAQCEMSHVNDLLGKEFTIKCHMNHQHDVWRRLWKQCAVLVNKKISINSISCFISPAGGQTPLHYDKNSVLVIQLKGLKNIGIQKLPLNNNPNEDYLVPDQSLLLDVWHQMKKGQLVYIPAGYVHATNTEALSLTLGVGFSILGCSA